MLTVPPPARIPWLGETEVSVGAGQAARATPQLLACVQLKLSTRTHGNVRHSLAIFRACIDALPHVRMAEQL